MRAILRLSACLLLASAGLAAAEPRDSSDRALGSETSRERAQMRIERLREDRTQKTDRERVDQTKERRSTTPSNRSSRSTQQ